MPVHTDGANGTGIGTQTPTLNPGVKSPLKAGGGAGCGGGGAATHELDGASNTVPHPHSTALLTPGEITMTYASGAKAAAQMIAKR